MAASIKRPMPLDHGGQHGAELRQAWSEQGIGHEGRPERAVERCLGRGHQFGCADLWIGGWTWP